MYNDPHSVHWFQSISRNKIILFNYQSKNMHHLWRYCQKWVWAKKDAKSILVCCLGTRHSYTRMDSGYFQPRQCPLTFEWWASLMISDSLSNAPARYKFFFLDKTHNNASGLFVRKIGPTRAEWFVSVPKLQLHYKNKDSRLECTTPRHQKVVNMNNGSINSTGVAGTRTQTDPTDTTALRLFFNSQTDLWHRAVIVENARVS